MSRHSQLKRSREQWKEKAKGRGEEVRYVRKELGRVKTERDRFKQEAKEARAQLKQRGPQAGLAGVRSKVDVVFMALQLFLVARIGFRAVSRVLEVLSAQLGLHKAPCPQTIINWVTRLSMSRMEQAEPGVNAEGRCEGDRFSNGCLWLLDISIALGAGKILAVLALNVRHHALNAGAPALHNVRCVAVAVAPTWTGETIAALLQQVIAVLGRPAGFLKDGGADLGKAARLLGERGWPSPCIADLSHVLANLLKHEYSHHPLFDTFLSACGKTSQKLKQTVLACLAPPKVSSKARFMNLHRLVRWADQLLKHAPEECVAAESLTAKLRASLDQLPACKAFIHRFLRDATPLLACQKVLKIQGLSKATAQHCETLIEPIPLTSAVRVGFTNWLHAQLHIAETLAVADSGLPISSDPIESLFGVVKHHGAGETKDAYRLATRLPALCGPLTKDDAQRVLNVSLAQQHAVIGSPPSLSQQRRCILPHPGALNHLTVADTEPPFVLIPGAKNRSKNPITSTLSDHYTKTTDPPMSTQHIPSARSKDHTRALLMTA